MAVGVASHKRSGLTPPARACIAFPARIQIKLPGVTFGIAIPWSSASILANLSRSPQLCCG